MDDSARGPFLFLGSSLWAVALVVFVLRNRFNEAILRSWLELRDRHGWWGWSGRRFLPKPQTEENWRGVIQRRTWLLLAGYLGVGLWALLIGVGLDFLGILVSVGIIVGGPAAVIVVLIKERQARDGAPPNAAR